MNKMAELLVTTNKDEYYLNESGTVSIVGAIKLGAQ